MIDEDIIKDIIKAMENGFEKDKEHFSVTRDVFTARLESFIIDTKKYLEAAIIGEIGNNTFDHNFVFKNIRQKGVYCNFDSMRRVHTPSACLPREAGSWVVDFQKKYVVLSDYGRGVKDSLIHIMPNIKNDLEALEIAFTKKISGRSPEQRGNGLKFVSETIQNNNWYLYFQSGDAHCQINKGGISYAKSNAYLLGCLAIINFYGDN